MITELDEMVDDAPEGRFIGVRLPLTEKQEQTLKAYAGVAGMTPDQFVLYATLLQVDRPEANKMTGGGE